MTILAELAARALRAAREADGSTRALAALHVLDTSGCVAAGASHPLAAGLAALAETGGAGGLPVTGLAGRHRCARLFWWSRCWRTWTSSTRCIRPPRWCRPP